MKSLRHFLQNELYNLFHSKSFLFVLLILLLIVTADDILAYKLYKEYKALLDGIEEAKELLNENDPEIKEMAKMELEELEKKQPIMEHDIQIELIPKDPNDEKNVVMEIRGAAGGDEGNI